jgi:hypothetical protein
MVLRHRKTAFWGKLRRPTGPVQRVRSDRPSRGKWSQNSSADAVRAQPGSTVEADSLRRIVQQLLIQLINQAVQVTAITAHKRDRSEHYPDRKSN